MNFLMNFLELALCEADGTPSSTRLNLLALLVFCMGLITAAFIVEGKLPTIPDSLERLIEFLFAVATGKIMFGGITDTAKAIFGAKANEAKNGTE